MPTHIIKVRLEDYKEFKYLRRYHLFEFDDRGYALKDLILLVAEGVSELKYPPLKRSITALENDKNSQVPRGFCVFSMLPVSGKDWPLPD